MVKAALGVEQLVNVGRNADFAWDLFDSAAYFEHNYRQLRADDRKIIVTIADHFNGISPRMRGARATTSCSCSSVVGRCRVVARYSWYPAQL